MIVLRSDHAANERELVRHPGHQRKVLANFDARDIGTDWFEFAADLGRRIHLEVERILVRWPTREINHDDRFVGASKARRRFGLKELRQSQSAKAKRSYPKKVSARNAVTEL